MKLNFILDREGKGNKVRRFNQTRKQTKKRRKQRQRRRRQQQQLHEEEEKEEKDLYDMFCNTTCSSFYKFILQKQIP